MANVTKERIAERFKSSLDLGIDFEPSTDYDSEKGMKAMAQALNLYGCKNPTLRYIINLSEYIDRLETALYNANLKIDDLEEQVIALEMIVGVD